MQEMIIEAINNYERRVVFNDPGSDEGKGEICFSQIDNCLFWGNHVTFFFLKVRGSQSLHLQYR